MGSLSMVMLCACIVAVTAQFPFDAGVSSFGSAYFAPAVYGEVSGAAPGVRDPRANTGPVLFPPSPPGDPSQTSGVVIGGSGYGFVPPRSQGSRFPRFYYQQFYFR